jgi:hypothetical protein
MMFCFRNERISYPIYLSNYFAYGKIEEDQLTVWSIFYNESKSLLPTNIGSAINIQRYMYLAKNRGFMVYKMEDKIFASMVSLNFDKATYKLIGKSYHIPNHDDYQSIYWGGKLFRLSDDIVCTACQTSNFEQTEVRLFKVNQQVTNCELQQIISVAEYGDYFTLIDGKLIFALFESISHDYDPLCLDAMIIRSADGKITRLQNTGIYLSKREHDDISRIVSD